MVPGNHHRHIEFSFLAGLDDGEDRGLGVERVEDGLDQKQVGAAVEQAADLFAIGFAQIVEGDRAIAGIGNVRRDRRRAVGRAERARDEAAAAILALGLQRRLMRQPRALAVELVGDLRHAVIGLRDRGRGKCIRRDDVGAGAKIREMDLADRIRSAEIEQVVVAAHLAVPGVEAGAAIALLVELHLLDHRAHRAVEHQDARGRGLANGFRWCLGLGVGRCHASLRFQAAACFAAGRRPNRWQIA